MKGMRPLVAGQLALSVVVVFAAGLMGRTLINFTRMDPGFVADHLVTARFDPYTGGYSRDQMSALGHRLVAAVTAVPGVVAASVSTCGLVANCSYTGGFRIEGGGEGISLLQNWVGLGVLRRDWCPNRQRARVRRPGYGTKPARRNRDRVNRAPLSFKDRIRSANALEASSSTRRLSASSRTPAG